MRCLLALVLGCTTVSARAVEIRVAAARADTVVALERAVNALGSPSADYRKVLQDTLTSLPRGNQDFVGTDLAAFLRRAPSAGADFKCGADFLRYKARQQLLRLKDTLLDASPQTPQPQFCYAAPFAVDPTRPINPIELYGYDFDREPVQILLMNDYGFEDVTFALSVRSHYHLTLDLAGNGVELSSNNRVLGLTWGHLIRHSIPLIQPTTLLCPSRVEEVPAGKTISYAPPPMNAETGLLEAGAGVFANATFDYDSNKLDATICLTATRRGSRAPISGCAVEFVYTSEPERLIEWVFGDLQALISSTHGDRVNEVTNGAPRSLVAQWTFAGFGGNSPAGMEAQLSIRLRKIRIVSTKIDDCVSPMAYLEAKRAHALSLNTIRSVDSQLKKVDPEILRLRPRFAPSS